MKELVQLTFVDLLQMQDCVKLRAIKDQEPGLSCPRKPYSVTRTDDSAIRLGFDQVKRTQKQLVGDFASTFPACRHLVHCSRREQLDFWLC